MKSASRAGSPGECGWLGHQGGVLAIMRLGPDAYGVSIQQEIEARTGRGVSLGAIYPTVDRLETTARGEGGFGHSGVE